MEHSPSDIGRQLFSTYFKTFEYPFTRHHIDSYDQFLSVDLPSILQSSNPFLLMKNLIPGTNTYMYRVEVFIGGMDGTQVRIGSPTVSLQKTKEVRLLFPNEARLRNLTYSASVYADIVFRITIQDPNRKADAEEVQPTLLTFENVALFRIPILLHSRYCLLHGKPHSFLREAGECIQDQGGYFIVDGSEKILITQQEQAFNTLYIRRKDNDLKVETHGSITCLSPVTRQVKVIAFYWMRTTETLLVSIPFVRKPIPLFVLFRALGLQADEDILRVIYPDLESAEAKAMIPLLLPSIAESHPFTDQFSAIQYIKVLTKGFSEAHVLDILYNQVFIHIQERKAARIHFLADCVRKFMRVHTQFDPKTDRDDTRNQRCLTTGFLVGLLFQGIYSTWKKQVLRAIDSEYEYNKTSYAGEKFKELFSPGNASRIFVPGFMTDELMRAFKGKWGSSGGGEERTGVLQAMSRLSYLDFMSHCRRVVLKFDTGMKLTGPRQLHTSQYGYFCTSETPGGSSIGITKNMSLMTLISTNTDPTPIQNFLLSRGWVIPCSEMRNDLQCVAIPVFLNNGIMGYTLHPKDLKETLKHMKWSGCLPPLSSITFSIRDRRILLFFDEGRPMRPLIHLDLSNDRREYPLSTIESAKRWRDLVVGTLPLTAERGISTIGFVDPFASKAGPIQFSEYIEYLKPFCGVIEYVDPYEQNETFIVNFKEEITPDTSHVEVHPSTILSIVSSMIPFPNHNQSPRNQLSCSQSKQGVSLYATNFQNRYDNNANILCYGEAPLVRTLVYDVLGEGSMSYGTTLLLAMGSYTGFNRDDGIIMNADSIARGLFRSMNYRTYEAFEEVDQVAQTTTRIANPERVPAWLNLAPGLDYGKLDERGIIKPGEVVDETTVLVARYIQTKSGTIKDSSVTAQVWTHGRVESVVVTVSNTGMRLVKVRVTQDRVPELGDKFSNRHGQKGTIGMLIRGEDMPRTRDGLVPDMIMNPHAIPSRMTIAQLIEMIFGKALVASCSIGDATCFMNDETVVERIGDVLQNQFGMERYGNEILYNGMTGEIMETNIFMGQVFTMRLKHMVEDKWNARAEGRREQRTHQPTGGRGNQGGLRIGEMERDAIACHGASDFLQESFMKRSDGTTIRYCNGCGTIPIYNEKESVLFCTLCDGPAQYSGTNATNLELLPPTQKSLLTTSVVQIPYAMKVLGDELAAYLNMGIRVLPGRNLMRLQQPPLTLEDKTQIKALMEQELPEVVLPEMRIPEYKEQKEVVEPAPEDLVALGLLPAAAGLGGEAEGGPEEETEEDIQAQAFAQTAALQAEQAQAQQQVSTTTPPFGGTTTPPFGGTTTPPFGGTTTPPFGETMTPPFAQTSTPPFDGTTTQYIPSSAPVPVQVQQPMPQPQQQMTSITIDVPMPQQQQQQQQQPPFTPAAVQVLQAPVPGGPQTLVVDTSPEQMAALPPLRIGQAPMVGGAGAATAAPARPRHITPRKHMTAGASGAPINPNQRISIRKLG